MHVHYLVTRRINTASCIEDNMIKEILRWPSSPRVFPCTLFYEQNKFNLSHTYKSPHTHTKYLLFRWNVPEFPFLCFLLSSLAWHYIVTLRKMRSESSVTCGPHCESFTERWRRTKRCEDRDLETGRTACSGPASTTMRRCHSHCGYHFNGSDPNER